MSDIAENQFAAPLTQYDELPDAPPKRRLKFSIVGKIAITIVVFWVVIAVTGPFIAPYHEADIIAMTVYRGGYGLFRIRRGSV